MMLRYHGNRQSTAAATCSRTIQTSVNNYYLTTTTATTGSCTTTTRTTTHRSPSCHDSCNIVSSSSSSKTPPTTTTTKKAVANAAAAAAADSAANADCTADAAAATKLNLHVVPPRAIFPWRSCSRPLPHLTRPARPGNDGVVKSDSFFGSTATDEDDDDDAVDDHHDCDYYTKGGPLGPGWPSPMLPWFRYSLQLTSMNLLGHSWFSLLLMPMLDWTLDMAAAVIVVAKITAAAMMMTLSAGAV